jgi:hypothetical protein
MPNENEQTNSTTPQPTPTPTPATPAATTPTTPTEPATSLVNGTAPEKAATETPKPAETPKPETAPAEPITAADITIPDAYKSAVSEPIQSKFLGIMNDAQMSAKERVQALVDLQAEAFDAASEKGSQAWNELQKTWRDEVVSEFGAQEMPQVQARVGNLLDRFGDQKTREAFDLTGAGNNPAIVRFFNKIAVAMGEQGRPVSPGANPGSIGGRSEDEVAARLFPSMAKKT